MRFPTEDMLKQELAALPELTPPPETEARVLAAMRRPAAEPRPRPWKASAFVALALAAAAAFAAVLVLRQPRAVLDEQPLLATDVPQLSFEDYAALVEQSAQHRKVMLLIVNRIVWRRWSGPSERGVARLARTPFEFVVMRHAAGRRTHDIERIERGHARA